ncbi:MAG: hypothetical protein AAGI23_17105 [Bacteroidota bacterium]
MTRLSSNWTLFYKFFIPTFWIVFGGACLVAVWKLGITLAPGISPRSFALIYTVSYLAGIGFLYVFVMRLKRVEVDHQYVYVTNYFKNYRYPHRDIDYIQDSKLPFFGRAYLQLKAPGSLGYRITYLPVKGWLEDFLREHSESTLEVREG